MLNEDSIESKIYEVIEECGWTFEKDLQRDYSDVIVESKLRAALIRLNPEIKANPEYADIVIKRIKKLTINVDQYDLISKNEEFKKIVFEENSYPFGENGKDVPIKIFGTLNEDELNLNEYTVTHQWIYPQIKDGRRFDIVLLVNGIPLVIGELKTAFSNKISWFDGASDLQSYEQSIPQMFVYNAFNFATDGKNYRYGAIKQPLDLWGPWITKGVKNEENLISVLAYIKDMLQPHRVMDIFRFYTLFSTDIKNTKIKIICRYQQYEGANAIINRILHGKTKTGLIWHFQGSGKSLLMVFAAHKIRSIPELNNPTVVLVDDRVDLETQITGTFNAAEIANLYSVSDKDDLIWFFKNDQRKILFTTIFKFDKVSEVLNTRENIIVLVDEAHRTQEGDLGMKMRMALPNAYFFGLTGTPINKRDKNTFRTFGSSEDENGYLSLYSFTDSINDHATLPLRFEPVPLSLRINKEDLNAEFDELTKEENLTDEEKAKLVSRVNMTALMTNEKRITQICQHIAKHFTTKIEPNGYKGQVVCYNREACVLYKKHLDELLGKDASAVVMTVNNDKADIYKDYKLTKSDQENIIKKFKDKDSQLKLLIVTDKLLTGFDAPVEQVMYLDKIVKEHNLLQAVCRTNRVLDDCKSFGLIVDYVGIFDDIAKALNFDVKEMQTIVKNIELVKKEIPFLVDNCLKFFTGVTICDYSIETLLDCQHCLEGEKKEQFAANYNVLKRAYEALSPDSCLEPIIDVYKWLTKIYQSVKPVDDSGQLIWNKLGKKTLELVKDNVEVTGIDEDQEVLDLSVELIEAYIKDKYGSIEKGSKKIEIDLIAKIRHNISNAKFKEIGKKLEELRDKLSQGLIDSISFLKDLIELARKAREAEKLDGQDVISEKEIKEAEGKAQLTKLFEKVNNKNIPQFVSKVVNDIDSIVKKIIIEDWHKSEQVKKEIKQELRQLLWVQYHLKDDALFNEAYSYIEQYY